MNGKSGILAVTVVAATIIVLAVKELNVAPVELIVAIVVLFACNTNEDPVGEVTVLDVTPLEEITVPPANGVNVMLRLVESD